MGPGLPRGRGGGTAFVGDAVAVAAEAAAAAASFLAESFRRSPDAAAAVVTRALRCRRRRRCCCCCCSCWRLVSVPARGADEEFVRALDALAAVVRVQDAAESAYGRVVDAQCAGHEGAGRGRSGGRGEGPPGKVRPVHPAFCRHSEEAPRCPVAAAKRAEFVGPWGRGRWGRGGRYRGLVSLQLLSSAIKVVLMYVL